MMMMRSIYRSICRKSIGLSAAASATKAINNQNSRYFQTSLPHSFSPKRDCQRPFAMGIGSTRSFSEEVSEDVSHMPGFKDRDVEIVFKDLMAASWDEIPDTVIHDAKKALSKNIDDKAGQEALANLFRAAEACEEFIGILVSLRMAIDDSIGLSGEDVKPISDEFLYALCTVYLRYNEYMHSFGPDEGYLRKKVENEVGTKMIHLKQRCSFLGTDFGKVTVIGTSGLSGSYVEQRA